MIAGTVAVFVKGELKWWRKGVAPPNNVVSDARINTSRRRDECLRILYFIFPFLSCADASDDELFAFQPANHIHIDHRHGVRKRYNGMIDVVVRSNQAFFFAAEG